MSTQDILFQAAGKNAELLNGLSQTEYAKSALSQSQAYLKDLDHEVRQCNKQVSILSAKTRSEHADHKKYEESVMRRFLYRAGGKKERWAEKASKEEREYVEALNAEIQAKSRRDEWVKNRDMERQKCAELQQIAYTHDQLQVELDALYNSIFGGPTPDVPGEDQKEWALREARDNFNTVKQHHEAEMQAFKCLQEANSFMHKAMESLADARMHSRMDMFGGGRLTDMMERDALHRAENATDKVRMLVSQAQRISPETQGLGQIEIAHGHMTDVYFDNIFSDMAMHDDIKRSQAQCDNEARRLQALTSAAKMKSESLGMEAGQALQRLEYARRELQQVRQEAFERLAQPPAYDQSNPHYQ